MKLLVWPFCHCLVIYKIKNLLNLSRFWQNSTRVPIYIGLFKKLVKKKIPFYIILNKFASVSIFIATAIDKTKTEKYCSKT